MLSLERCRKIDPDLKDLSDEELLSARDLLYEFAQLALENWSKEEGSKNPVGVLLDKSSSIE